MRRCTGKPRRCRRRRRRPTRGTSCGAASRRSVTARGPNGSTGSTSASRARRWASAWRCSPVSCVIGATEERAMTIIDQPAAGTTPASGGGLQRRALGVPDLVFFIVAASAPLTAVAGGQAATYLVTGNKGIPFLFIPLAIILGIFAVGYA